MRQTNALKHLLEDLSAVYNDGTRVDVQFAKPGQASSASPNGTVTVSPNVRQDLGRDLSGANELRVMVDTLSHEVEHIRESELTGKKEFMGHYPQAPRIAGAVINILEDQYIDWTRTNRFRGLKPAHAFVVDVLMQNHSRRPRIDQMDKPNAMMEGLLQVAFAGYAKHIADADDDVREFLGRARPLIDATRREHDAEVREANAHRLMRMLLSYLDADETDEAEGYVDKMRVRAVPDADDVVPRDLDSVDDAQADLDEYDADDDHDGDDGGLPDDLDVDVDDLDLSDAEVSEADDDADADGDAAVANLSPDDLSAIEDELAEMDEIDDGPRSGAAGDWFDLDESADYHEADEQDERRYEALRRRIQQAEDPLTQQRRDRDDREELDAGSYEHSDEVREAMRDDDLATRIERAFRELKTRDRFEPKRSGQRVNTRAFNRLKAGNQKARRELFMHRDVVELGDRAVHVCVDMSGSMDGKQAKIALAALHEATDAIGDSFSANAFGTQFEENAALITGPDEDFEWRHLDTVAAQGGTPTATGVLRATEVLDRAAKPEKLLVVITDGRANVDLDDGRYGGSPTSDARAMVDHARQQGMKVIGLAVDTDASYLSKIFGDDVLSTDMANLPAALVEIYNRQMSTGRAELR